MILIEEIDLYCKKDLFKSATEKRKSKASDLARFIMLGSIERDYLLFCTLTGKLGNNRKNMGLTEENVLQLTPKIYDIISKYEIKY